MRILPLLTFLNRHCSLMFWKNTGALTEYTIIQRRIKVSSETHLVLLTWEHSSPFKDPQLSLGVLLPGTHPYCIPKAQSPYPSSGIDITTTGTLLFHICLSIAPILYLNFCVFILMHLFGALRDFPFSLQVQWCKKKFLMQNLCRILLSYGGRLRREVSAFFFPSYRLVSFFWGSILNILIREKPSLGLELLREKTNSEQKHTLPLMTNTCF